MNDVKWWLVAVTVAAAVVLALVMRPPGDPNTDLSVDAEPRGLAETTHERHLALIQHEIFVGDQDKPVILVIEENHASLAVQREVTSAIELIANVMPHAVLLIEGTRPGRLDLPIRTATGLNPLWLTATAQAWFELGWLSGAELAALRLPDVPVWGAEEPDGPERIAHWEILQQRRDVWNEALSLFERLLGFWDLEVLSTVLALTEAVESSEKHLVAGVPVHEAMAQFSARTRKDRYAYYALADLAGTLVAVEEPYSATHEDLEGARQRFVEAVVTAASVRGLVDPAESRELLDRSRQVQEDSAAAAAGRHRHILANTLLALQHEGSYVGVVVIGSGHTYEFTTVLRSEGISHVVVTPLSLPARTPAREIARFEESHDRRRQGRPADPVTEWLAQGAYKAPAILSDPRTQEVFTAMCLLLESTDLALRDKPVPLVRSGDVIRSVTVDRTAESISVSVVGTSGRRLVWRFPHGFSLTPTAASELAKHTLEALEAGHLLMPRADGFFTPAAHVYLEPDAFHGGALLSHMPDASTLITQASTFGLPLSVDSMVASYADLMREDIEHLKSVGLDKTTVRRRKPAELFDLLEITDHLMITLDSMLGACGIPLDQVVPVALRLSPLGGQNESRLRQVNFTLLASMARLAGVGGYERRIMFVNSCLEPDSHLIVEGDRERPLASTLGNVHRWRATSRHIAVLTVPTTTEAYMDAPYADFLGWSTREYEDNVLRHLERAIQAVGPQNVMRPQTRDEFFAMLRGELQGAPDATITLTLVAHLQYADQEPLIHFGAEPNVPLAGVLQGLERLQREGQIPDAGYLEYNVLICSGEESADAFVRRLGARLVLSSPRMLDLATNSVLLEGVARRLGDGSPLYLAHFETEEEMLYAILERSGEELDRQGIRSLEMPGPTSMNIDSKQTPIRGA